MGGTPIKFLRPNFSQVLAPLALWKRYCISLQGLFKH